MATVVVSWTTKQQSFPAGTVGGISQVSLLAANGVDAITAPQNASGASATFTGIAAGNYVARIRKYDGAGNTVLGEATVAFSVAPATTNVDVPDVVTVSFS